MTAMFDMHTSGTSGQYVYLPPRPWAEFKALEQATAAEGAKKYRELWP